MIHMDERDDKRANINTGGLMPKGKWICTAVEEGILSRYRIWTYTCYIYPLRFYLERI
jgi:hypothetical protein